MITWTGSREQRDTAGSRAGHAATLLTRHDAAMQKYLRLEALERARQAVIAGQLCEVTEDEIGVVELHRV
jgi:hypothetical protein